MDTVRSPKTGEMAEALWKVTKVVLDTLDYGQVTQAVCDSLLSELGYLELGYRIIVLILYDQDKKGLQRVSLSQTLEAKAATEASSIPFEKIVVPIDADENILIRAFKEKKPFTTHDWKDILSPPLLPDDARKNQQAAGIKTSMVFPIEVRSQTVGVAIFSMIKGEEEVSPEEFNLIKGFMEIVGIAVEDAKLYSQLGEANEKLKELDRLKDEFVSIASHELRSPAATVKNYLWSVLNDGVNLTEQERSGIMKAADANDRLVKLVNDLLDVSRIEAGRLQVAPEVFDLGGLTAETAEEIKKKLGQNGETITVETENVPVSADKEKIRQVVINLLDNAIKYSLPGKPVAVKVFRKEGAARVEVIDQGVGISEDQSGKIFTKFGRLDISETALGKISGTGLGLYICKKIIELSGGTIGFDSKPGEGTTFWFELAAT